MRVDVIPKPPRWITTEAGRRAWDERENWRERAAQAFAVSERAALLAEAEQEVPEPHVESEVVS